MVKIRSPNDVSVGVFLLAFAAVAFWLTRDLRIGSSLRMGPGYMPFALSCILVVLGVISCLRGLTLDGEAAERWTLRPVAVISASIAFFGLSIERLGLVIAVVGLVFIGSLADPGTKRGESALLSIGLALFCVVVFVKALNLPMPLLPVEFR